MNKLYGIFYIVLVLTGCSTMSIRDQCKTAEAIAEYGSVNQCVTEKYLERAEERASIQASKNTYNSVYNATRNGF